MKNSDFNEKILKGDMKQFCVLNAKVKLVSELFEQWTS